MLRATRQLHTAAARHLHHASAHSASGAASASAAAAVPSHAFHTRAAAFLPPVHSASSTLRAATAQRCFHSAACRCNEPSEEEQRAAAIAAHRERMRLKNLKQAEQPTPAADAAAAPESETATNANASAGTETASNATAGDATASSSVASQPRITQPLLNKFWKFIGSEVHNIQEHMKAKRAPEKRVKQRPVVQKSRIPMKAWSDDPKQEAEARAAEEAAARKAGGGGAAAKEEEPKPKTVEEMMAEEQAAMEAAMAKMEAASQPYTGPSALQTVDTSTVWDKRLELLRERLRYFGMGGKKGVRKAVTAVGAGEQLNKIQEKLTEKMETFNENWETSQDPRVLRYRDLVDSVVGETETGQAIGTILKEDASFNYLEFLQEMEEVMIPEIVHAFRLGDMKLLKSVCEGEAARYMFAVFRQREEQGIEVDARTLDVRGVDIVKASLEDDVPSISISFVCQHVAAEYDAKTGEIKDPTLASTVQNTYYQWTIRRDYESPYYNWKITQFHSQHIMGLGI